MTVLDAFALIAFFAGEPAASDVETLLRSAEDRSRLSAVNMIETIDVLVRMRKHSLEDVHQRLDWLRAEGLSLELLDPEAAAVAGTLRAAHYGRRACEVSLADCAALATALAFGEALATADPALAAVARTEGVEVVALPDSQGRRP